MPSLSLQTLLENSNKHLKVIVVGSKDWSARQLKTFFHICNDRRFTLGASPLSLVLWANLSGQNILELATHMQTSGVASLTTHVGLKTLSALTFNILLTATTAKGWWAAGKGLEWSDLNKNSFKRRALKAIKEDDIATLQALDKEKPRTWNWKSLTPPKYRDPANPTKYTRGSMELQTSLETALESDSWEAIAFLLDKDVKFKIPDQSFYEDLSTFRNAELDSMDEDDMLDYLTKPYKAFFAFAETANPKAVDIMFKKLLTLPTFPTLAALDFMFERSYDNAEFIQSTVESFNRHRDIFPIQELKAALKLLKECDKTVGILKDPDTLPLRQAIQSYLEKDQLLKKLPEATPINPIQRSQRL